MAGVSVGDALFRRQLYHIRLVEGGQRRNQSDRPSDGAFEESLRLAEESRGLVGKEARVLVEKPNRYGVGAALDRIGCRSQEKEGVTPWRIGVLQHTKARVRQT